MRRFLAIWITVFFLGAAEVMFPTSAIGGTEEDVSMLLLGAGGVQLASPEIALSLAEMIFKKIYGEADLSAQMPLHIGDGGDRWIVDGSGNSSEAATPEDQPVKGKMEIVILKRNCQILKLVQYGQLAPLTGFPLK